MEINTKDFCVISNMICGKISCDGICFTDGEFFVLDQYIMDNTHAFTDFFIENFEAEIIVNFLNEDESGFIILKTKYNIFGENYDKSKSKT